MGINGLTPFLKKYAPNAFSTVSLSTFAQKRIAIDISLFLYKYKVILGEQWITGIIQLLTCLRSHAIHPIVIFDGEAPIEKMKEQKTRREVRKKRNNTYLLLMGQVDRYNKSGIISPELQEFHDKGVYNLQKKYSPMLLFYQQSKEKVNTFDINFVLEKLSKIHSQNVRVTYQDVHFVQKVLKVMNIQDIQAPTEAEGLCSQLAIKGMVTGVLTEDTDVLAYGSPLFLSKINTLTNTCTLIEYNKVLQELGMTREQFTEFCIMCGCDYNQRIKGVGPSRIYRLFKKYGSFEGIIQNERNLDTECIQMKRVKELFALDVLVGIIDQIILDEWYSGTPKFTDIESFFQENGITSPALEEVYNACLQDARNLAVAKSCCVYKKRSSPFNK